MDSNHKLILQWIELNRARKYMDKTTVQLVMPSPSVLVTLTDLVNLVKKCVQNPEKDKK